jgi:nucleoside-diphosphate-sugar epimerase
MEGQKLFILGGTGFIGAETIREAVARGLEVRALARSEQKAERLRALGAIPVLGDAREPRVWIGAARGADALLDLVQPELPTRIRPKDIRAISGTRQEMTRGLLACLRELRPEVRPLLVSVSGIDDLAPDAQGRIDASSSLRTAPTGFGHIGVPVRRLIEAAGTATTFVHLGTVYGPGKSFAATVFPRLARGRMLLPRRAENRLPLIHVRDAARALVHLTSLGRDRLIGRSWILVNAAGGARLGEFFDQAAACLGVARPARVPAWILSGLMGRIFFETLSRNVEADAADLIATGFRFTYPTIREGLPATLSALGYSPQAAVVPAAAHRGGRWRVGWLLLSSLAAMIAVNALDFPLSVPALRNLAGGEPILDMRFGYSPRAAYQLLDALGSTGRARYLGMLWTVDLLLPALFALFLWSAVSRGALRKWRWVALGAGAADYLENVAITALLLGYPTHRDALASLASLLTVSKFALYLVALALAVYGGWRTMRTSRVLRRPAHPEAS